MIAFDPTLVNFLKKIQDMTNQLGVDVVYDSVGKDTMFNSFKACLSGVSWYRETYFEMD